MKFSDPILIEKENLLTEAHRLKEDEGCDFFIDLCVVDEPSETNRFELNYILMYDYIVVALEFSVFRRQKNKFGTK